MSSNTLIEVFGYIVFRFTPSVTEHSDPEEPEFTAESFGYDPLQSTGREWNYLPVDQLIYQEYSDREVISFNYPVANSLNVRVINARSPKENEETQEDQQDEDRAMAWKRLRTSALRTVCKSMYIGALISFFTATMIGSVYLLFSYLCFQTKLHCELHPRTSIPVKVQWMRTISHVIDEFSKYIYFFAIMLSFSPISVNGSEKKTYSDFLLVLLPVCTLSRGSRSPRNILFHDYSITKFSSRRIAFDQYMLASLFSNETFLHTI